ncbi:MAG: hypothetical protein HPAVJP_5290 [Candidatus Hepatoplasma vulgare]|nr:MAG: hypothetical protein HPAVJP_5290 [Candidatus Hepatoplasma sp.]
MNTKELIDILKKDKIFSLLFLFNSKVIKKDKNFYVSIQWNNKPRSKILNKKKFIEDFENYFSKIKFLNFDNKELFNYDLKTKEKLEAKNKYLNIFDSIFENLIFNYKLNKKHIIEDFIISIFIPRGTYEKTIQVDIFKNEKIFTDTSFFQYAKNKYQKLKEIFPELDIISIKDIKLSKREQNYFQLTSKLKDIIKNTNEFNESKFLLINSSKKEKGTINNIKTKSNYFSLNLSKNNNYILEKIYEYDKKIDEYDKKNKENEKNKFIKERNPWIIKWGQEKLENFCYGCFGRHNLKFKSFKKKDEEDKWYLEIHHILPFSLDPQNNDNIYNLTNLCPVCHRALTSANDNIKKEIIINFLNNSSKEVLVFLKNRFNISNINELSKEIIKTY